MIFADIFYIIFIWPVRFIIEFFFLAFKEIFNDNIGITIIFLSIVVNVLLLPIYNIAEKWQKHERLLQEQMKPVIFRIRKFFTGDERQMLINAYYRQKHYSPFNLRSSFGLLLQIPFFIAAYNFLSHSASVNGNFLFIPNLGAPDGLLNISVFSINILPIIMTVFNLLSSFVYSYNLSVREKIQLFFIPALFLILLYNFPSGMVLYWTFNNLFSLVKNITLRFSKNPLKILYYIYAFCLTLVVLALALGLTGINRYRIHFIIICCILIILPLFTKKFLSIIGNINKFNIEQNKERLFFLFPLILFSLITGVITPLQLIISSPQDFLNPILFLIRTSLQSFSLFILLPYLIYHFGNILIKRILCLSSIFLCFTGAFSYFFFTPLYGTMTRAFKFENTNHLLDAYNSLFNLFIILPGIILILLLFILKNKNIISGFMKISVISVLMFIIFNISAYALTNNHDRKINNNESNYASSLEGFYKFSLTGNNVLYIFLDRAAGAAFFDVLKYLPDLHEKLEGFTFYPNTLSFANFTVSGLTAVFGGYDYSPSEINKRIFNTMWGGDNLLENSINESYSVLASIFGKEKRVFVIDPPIADSRTIPAVTFFNNINNVSSLNINEYFNHKYKENFIEGKESSFESFDYDIIFRYGLFRTSLPAFRYLIYYNGKWWRDGRSTNFARALTGVSTLYYLKDMVTIDDGDDSLCILMNELTHDDAPFNSSLQLTAGSIVYSDEEEAFFNKHGHLQYIYTYCAAISLLTDFFDYLKQNNIYDNTKIIVVSDHGREYPNPFFESDGMERYNPLLLVKNYNEKGNLNISNEFMTNADAPLLAVSNINNPVNKYLNTPFTRPLLFSEYDIIVNDTPGSLKNHYKNGFKIIKSRKLLSNNIFSSSSWEDWKEGN